MKYLILTKEGKSFTRKVVQEVSSSKFVYRSHIEGAIDKLVSHHGVQRPIDPTEDLIDATLEILEVAKEDKEINWPR